MGWWLLEVLLLDGAALQCQEKNLPRASLILPNSKPGSLELFVPAPGPLVVHRLTLVLPFSRLIPDSRMDLTLAPLGAQLVRALSRAETLRTVLAPAPGGGGEGSLCNTEGPLRSPGLKVAQRGQ